LNVGVDAFVRAVHTVSQSSSRFCSMPSFKEICRAGFNRVRWKRHRRALRTSIERLQGERPALLEALGKAAWYSKAVTAEYSATASELRESVDILAKTRRSAEECAVKLAEAEERLAEAERESSIRLDAAVKPLRKTQAELKALEDRLRRLERERRRISNELPMWREAASKIESRIADHESDFGNETQLARFRTDLQRRLEIVTKLESRLEQIEEKEIAQLRSEIERTGGRLKSLRSDLEKQKREAAEVLNRLRYTLEACAGEKEKHERNARIVEAEIQPLFYQLGEELNGRRVFHAALGGHYAALDKQMTRLRGLYSSLLHTESNLRTMDTGAVILFWSITVSAILLLATAAALGAFFLLF